jgi:hypothetical protein
MRLIKKLATLATLLDIAAGRGEFLHAVDESRGDLLIDSLREQQRHVDVDALADQLAKRGYALGCAGDFDHQVFASDTVPQAARLVEGAGSVVRQIRGYFEAHVAVALVRALVDGSEQVGGVLNVANREQFVAALGVEVGARGERVQKILVLGGAAIAFSKMAGFEVMPRRPSSVIRRCSSPPWSRSRRM